MSEFLVDNSKLQAKSPGLGYRFSKKLEDKDREAVAPWGSTVTGVSEGDGWLKVQHERGERYLPFAAGGADVLVRKAANEGYVFVCGSDARRTSAQQGLLSASASELTRMRRHITGNTQLFLFDFECLTVLGPFRAQGTPELLAEGPKPCVQLRAEPLVPLREAKLERRLVAGPKSSSEVATLRAQLAAGTVPTVPWGAELIDEEPQEPQAESQEPQAELQAEPPVEPQAEPQAPEPEAKAVARASWLDSAPKGLEARSAQLNARPKGQPKAQLNAPPKAEPKAQIRPVQPKAAEPTEPEISTEPETKDTSAEPKPKAAGYVFLCGNATLPECKALWLFGSPARELGKMASGLGPETQLFLYNFDSGLLLGSFKAAGIPRLGIVPGAFGGRFGSQVRVTPVGELRQAKGAGRVSGGAKTAAQVESLVGLLEAGEAVEAWERSEEEPEAKRRKLDDESAAASPKAAAVEKKASTPMPTTLKAAHPAGKAGGPASPGRTSPRANTPEPPAVPKVPQPGYVFMCGKATLPACTKHRLFGSPDRELPQMRRSIAASTKVFLLNMDSLQLLGPFVPVGEPGKGLIPGAFGGKFQAHLRVAPLQRLRETKLEKRIAAGAKSAVEVKILMSHLQRGTPVSMEAWGPPAVDPEPPPPQAPPVESEQSVHRMPLAIGALADLPAEARADLEADLCTLAETCRITATLAMAADGSGRAGEDDDAVVLRGSAEALKLAQGDLHDVLQFYGVAPTQS